MKQFLRIFSIFLGLAIIAGSIYAAFNSRAILDYIALRGYTPPAEVSELADATTMQDPTRRVFYVNQPELQNRTDFRNSCTKQEETIVLGCYVTNLGIFILRVEDPRLEGIVEVTAAHEVLHAMYDRLSTAERERVDGLTAEYFATLDNERINKNIENYRNRDPGVVPNELHSILATEVRQLSPELEEYYSQYFSNRLAIVDLSEKYEQTFIEIEQQVEDYQAQLQSLKSELDTSEQRANSLASQIQDERNRLDFLLSNDRVDEYNASVSSFNSLVNQYNSVVQGRRADIERYNQIVERLNELVTTEAQLLESLSTEDAEIAPGAPSQ